MTVREKAELIVKDMVNVKSKCEKSQKYFIRPH